MARTASFTKRALISKANSTIVVATAVAAFIVVFAGFASKALFDQAAYQNKVISTKKKALATLNADIAAVDSLKESYTAFVNTPTNVLGGNPQGTGDKDGDNAKIVLDALPSRYDFPALATSLEKLITGQGLTIMGITGTDEEATQGEKQSSSDPQPVPMPYQVRVHGSYEGIKSLIDVFQRSIRPMQTQKIEISSGSQGAMEAIIDAQTFYQPEKNLNIKKEVVK
jgi:hypothetical protein